MATATEVAREMGGSLHGWRAIVTAENSNSERTRYPTTALPDLHEPTCGRWVGRETAVNIRRWKEPQANSNSRTLICCELPRGFERAHPHRRAARASSLSNGAVLSSSQTELGLATISPWMLAKGAPPSSCPDQCHRCASLAANSKAIVGCFSLEPRYLGAVQAVTCQLTRKWA